MAAGSNDSNPTKNAWRRNRGQLRINLHMGGSASGTIMKAPNLMLKEVSEEMAFNQG